LIISPASFKLRAAAIAHHAQEHRWRDRWLRQGGRVV